MAHNSATGIIHCYKDSVPQYLQDKGLCYLQRIPFSIAVLTANSIGSNSAPIKCILPTYFFSTSQLLTSCPDSSLLPEQFRAVTKATARPFTTYAFNYQKHFSIRFVSTAGTLYHLFNRAFLLNIKHFLTRLPFRLAAFWRILKDFFLNCSACSYLKTIIYSVRRMPNVAECSEKLLSYLSL